MQTNSTSWFECLTCKQEFTGGLALRLARERCRLCVHRPEEDEKRLDAAQSLAPTLRNNGELEEALQLGTEPLPTVRCVFGDEHDDTPTAMSRLAVVHSTMGDA